MFNIKQVQYAFHLGKPLNLSLAECVVNKAFHCRGNNDCSYKTNHISKRLLHGYVHPHCSCQRRCSSSSRQASVSMAFNSYGAAGSSKLPPIIIMHGILGSKNNWNSLSKSINSKTNRQVIAVDARNHGDSAHTDSFSYKLMADDVIHLMDEMMFDKSCLLGHSMGGRTMMRVALTYPERVEKLIVVDISPIQLSASLTIEKYLDLFNEVPLDNSLPLSQARREADVFLSNHVPEVDIRQFLLSNLTKVGNEFKWKANIRSLKKNFRNVLEYPLEREVFNGPVLFIGGKRSDFLRPQDHDRIKQYFPQAEFAYLDTGHWVHAEKPNEFLALANEFVLRS